MSCHGCSQSFGFLNRERGCPKCGFSYCKKCLRFNVPEKVSLSKNISGKTIQVCKKCYDIATSGVNIKDSKTSSLDLEDKMDPLSFRETVQVVKAIHRLESLENPAKPPIILYSQPKMQPEIEKLRSGMAPEDQQLVDRLANLRNTEKSKRKSSDAVEEITARLAHLRGEEHPVLNTDSKPFLGAQKNETEEELMERLAKETAINKRYEDAIVTDLEARLAKLRSPSKKSKSESESSGKVEHVDQNATIPEPEELTEEEEVKRIIERLTAEVAIDDASKSRDALGEVDDDPIEGPQHDMETDESDDEHMCRICDAKAVLRCKDCDDDEFCPKCFKEFHIEIGEVHKPTKL